MLGDSSHSILGKTAMISRPLTDHLCALLDAQLQCNPLFRLAERGELTRVQMGEYLYNTAYIALCTQTHVALGLLKAQAAGQPDLAEFFEDKRREEAGHAQWAFRDLTRLGLQSGAAALFQVREPLIQLLSCTQQELDKNPASYLIYSLFAESINSRIAPVIVNALTEQGAFSAEELSMLVKHAELDPHHVAEDCRFIDLASERGALRLDESCRFLDALVEQFAHFTHEIAQTQLDEAA